MREGVGEERPECKGGHNDWGARRRDKPSYGGTRNSIYSKGRKNEGHGVYVAVVDVPRTKASPLPECGRERCSAHYPRSDTSSGAKTGNGTSSRKASKGTARRARGL